MTKFIDLHTHTTASDGDLSPARIVSTAKSADLAAIAVTDHDTIGGLYEALGAGENLDFEVVPGVEVSVQHALGQMHIVGLFIDPGASELNNWLKKLIESRNERNPKIVRKLQGFGFDIRMEEVKGAAKGEAVGRPHIAQVLCDKGIVSSTREAFDKYLNRGRPAYVERMKATPGDAIAKIHNAGGLAILAHCHDCGVKNAGELEDVISRLKDLGLDGMEVRCSEFTPEEQDVAESICKKLALLPSGGSDFHGRSKPDIKLGVGRGNLEVPYSFLTALKDKHVRSKSNVSGL